MIGRSYLMIDVEEKTADAIIDAINPFASASSCSVAPTFDSNCCILFLFSASLMV
jgi:hypothetical protein